MVVLDILRSNIAICVYEAIIFAFVFKGWKKSRKKKKQSQEASSIQKELARDKKLDDLLHNELYTNTQERRFQNNTPYDELFHEEAIMEAAGPGTVKIQLTVLGKISTRKYILFVSEEVTVGNGPKNDLVVNDTEMSKQHCKLFVINDKLYVQSLDLGNPIMISRKKQTIPVAKDAVNIASLDEILLGSTKLQIEII